MYGFPSPDSDFDLRGAHVIPAKKILGLDYPRETAEINRTIDKMEIELVSHDVRKYFKLVLKNNGYVLEQIFSPLILHTTESHRELKRLSAQCITRRHALHYKGFAHNQWKLAKKNPDWPIKKLLYTYRVLLTGIHLMNTGRIEADLNFLAGEYRSGSELPGRRIRTEFSLYLD